MKQNLKLVVIKIMLNEKSRREWMGVEPTAARHATHRRF